VDVIHKQFLFLFRVVHEGERLNHFKEEALIDQELLALVSVIHLLSVSRHKGIEIGVKFLRIGKGLFFD
jgi:hypothetical protein